MSHSPSENTEYSLDVEKMLLPDEASIQAHENHAKPSWNTKKILLPLLILGLSILGFMYLKATKPQSKPIQVNEQVWIVETTEIKPARLSPTVTLYGHVESPRNTTLRAPTQALTANTEVITVTVLEGELIKKGQVLVSLDDRDSQFNLNQREADVTDIEAQIEMEQQNHANDMASIQHEEALLELTRKAANRAQKLVTEQVGAKSSVDEMQQAVERQMLTLNARKNQIKNYQSRLAQLQARLARAIASRDAARLELQRMHIIAPFSGVVTQVHVAPNDRIRSGDSLVSLYDHTALEVRAQIPDRYRHIVFDTLVAKQFLFANAMIDTREVLLRLDRVAGQVSQASGGIDGLFRVVKGEEGLRLGQFITLSLNLPVQLEIVALPFSAIYGTNRVYKLIDERMHGITVERIGEQTTPDHGSQVLVRSPDLRLGDTLIVTQLPNAMEGLKVQKTRSVAVH